MSFGIVCRQKPACKEYASFRYTWPGKDESFICAQHSKVLLGIAQAMGTYIQLIPLTEQDHAGAEGMKSIEEQRK